MLKDFQALRDLVGAGAPKTVAVACAHDAHTLEAVLHAASEGILKYVLVGHREEILRIGRELGHEIDPAAIVDADTDEEAARLAVQLIREDKADFLQKGYMQTSTILKAVVNKQTGIGTGGIISHTAFIEIPGYHKLLGSSATPWRPSGLWAMSAPWLPPSAPPRPSAPRSRRPWTPPP